MEHRLAYALGRRDACRTRRTTIEAEQALLGAILANNKAYRPGLRVPPRRSISPMRVHGRIYARHRAKLIERGQIANPVTLKNLFDQDGALAEVGGAPIPGAARRRGRHASSMPSDYGRTIHDLLSAPPADRRRRGRRQRRLQHDLEIDATRADRARRAEALRPRRRPARSRAASATFSAGADERDRAWPRPPSSATARSSGVTTGFADLDKKLGGLHPSDLVILAGRPVDGQDGARHQHRLQRGAGLSAEARRGRPTIDGRRGRRRGRVLLAGNVGRAARHPHPRPRKRGSPSRPASAAARSAREDFDKFVEASAAARGACRSSSTTRRPSRSRPCAPARGA